MRRHLEGDTPGFASRYGADRLVWFERHECIEDAIVREKKIKKWRRAWKLDLIQQANPAWRNLALEVVSEPGEALGMPDVGGVSAEEAAEYLGDAVLDERHRMDSRVRGNDRVGESGEDGLPGPSSRTGSAPNSHPLIPDSRVLEVGRAALRVAASMSLLLIAACGGEPPESQLVTEGPESLVALAVEVEAPAPDDSLGVVRSTFQVDGGSGSWYDALAGPGRDPAMGLTAAGRTVLHGWRWWSDTDSVALGPQDRVRGVARPDVAVRSYMERDTSGLAAKIIAQIQGERPARLSERVTLLDGRGDQAALLVEVADSIGIVGFWPVRSERRAGGEYTIRDLEDVLVFAADCRVATDSTVIPAGPIWTAVAGGTVRSSSAVADVPEGGRDQAFRMGEVLIETPGAIAVATGATAESAAAAARSALEDGAQRREARSERLAAVLEDVAFETQDETTNTAFRWAVLTLDALTVRDDSSRTTILPGLPGAEPASFPSAVWTLRRFPRHGSVGDGARHPDDDRRRPALRPADRLAWPRARPRPPGRAGRCVRDLRRDAAVPGRRGRLRPHDAATEVWCRAVPTSGSRQCSRSEASTRRTPATAPQWTRSAVLVARDRRGTWLEGDPEIGGIRRRGPVAEGQGALFGALKTATQFARIMGVSQRSSATWYADTSRVLVRGFERDFVQNGIVRDRLEGDGELTARWALGAVADGRSANRAAGAARSRLGRAARVPLRRRVAVSVRLPVPPLPRRARVLHRRVGPFERGCLDVARRPGRDLDG